MRISVFGLGYVGCVTATCLAANGHTVIGVDVDPRKVRLVESGRSPIIEPGLRELIASVVEADRLRATLDADEAVRETDISLVCVGTPSNRHGCVNLQFVDKVCSEIGRGLDSKPGYHVIVVRSTVLPGTVLDRLIPIIEQSSGRSAGSDFGVCMNPEFLREGSALKDYHHPAYTIIGQLDQRSGDMVEQLYGDVDAPIIRTTIPAAEMTKYTSNAFHALKVVFANEIGNLCKAHGVDGQEVMDIICQDRQLNVSSAYLKPGFAFGGSCLPKDVRALTYRAKERDVDVPLLNAIMESNQQQIQRGVELVERAGGRRIGILGLSFKPLTDDVRESPTVSLVETLVGRGYQVAIYDRNVDPSQLIGANRAFLERELPHIASLMRSSLEEVVRDADVIVVANGSSDFRHVPELLSEDQTLIDLVGIARNDRQMRGQYEGICW